MSERPPIRGTLTKSNAHWSQFRHTLTLTLTLTPLTLTLKIIIIYIKIKLWLFGRLAVQT